MGRSRIGKALKTLGWGALLAVWVGGALMASQYVVAWIFYAIFPEEELSGALIQTIYASCTYLLCLAVVVVVPLWLFKYKTTRDELGVRGLPTWIDLLLAPAGFVAFMFVAVILTAFLSAVLPWIDWAQAQETGYQDLISGADLGLAFFALVVLAPIAEELIFRGWLYGKLRGRMLALPAMLVVSVLFGVVHGQWNVGVTVFVMSLAMCVMRELTGTIWAGVLLHMLKNGIAFYLLYLSPIL